jgi:hypothetical protein
MLALTYHGPSALIQRLPKKKSPFFLLFKGTIGFTDTRVYFLHCPSRNFKPLYLEDRCQEGWAISEVFEL